MKYKKRGLLVACILLSSLSSLSVNAQVSKSSIRFHQKNEAIEEIEEQPIESSEEELIVVIPEETISSSTEGEALETSSSSIIEVENETITSQAPVESTLPQTGFKTSNLTGTAGIVLVIVTLFLRRRKENGRA